MVVGQRVLHNYDFIRALSRTRSTKKCSTLVSGASDDQLLAVVEIALNILKSRFPLKEEQIERLIPLAEEVRRLSRARSAKTARRIVQIGGNPLLSALLVPVVLEVGRYLLERNGAKNGSSA
jgi:hypothetical protein